MDLRLLLSEMPDAKLPEKETPKTVLPTAGAAVGMGAKAAPKELASPPSAGEQAGGGRLSISVDQMPAPGSMLSGYARFSSGAKAHWFLDDMGRLGLEPELGTGKPTRRTCRSSAPNSAACCSKRVERQDQPPVSGAGRFFADNVSKAHLSFAHDAGVQPAKP